MSWFEAARRRSSSGRRGCGCRRRRRRDGWSCGPTLSSSARPPRVTHRLPLALMYRCDTSCRDRGSDAGDRRPRAAQREPDARLRAAQAAGHHCSAHSGRSPTARSTRPCAGCAEAGWISEEAPLDASGAGGPLPARQAGLPADRRGQGAPGRTARRRRPGRLRGRGFRRPAGVLRARPARTSGCRSSKAGGGGWRSSGTA